MLPSDSLMVGKCANGVSAAIGAVLLGAFFAMTPWLILECDTCMARKAGSGIVDPALWCVGVDVVRLHTAGAFTLTSCADPSVEVLQASAPWWFVLLSGGFTLSMLIELATSAGHSGTVRNLGGAVLSLTAAATFRFRVLLAAGFHLGEWVPPKGIFEPGVLAGLRPVLLAIIGVAVPESVLLYARLAGWTLGRQVAACTVSGLGVVCAVALVPQILPEGVRYAVLVLAVGVIMPLIRAGSDRAGALMCKLWLRRAPHGKMGARFTSGEGTDAGGPDTTAPI